MALHSADDPANPYIIPVLAMHGELDAFLAEGWDLDWMTDQYNLDRVAVFHSDTAGDIYREILYYHRDNGVVPTRDRIEAGYPTTPIPWDTEITVTEVLTEARRNLRTVHTQMFLGDLQGFLETYDGKKRDHRAVEIDDIPAVAQLTENYLRRLQASGPATLPFRVLGKADLYALPDPEPLIEGVLDHGTVSMLAGESSKGKSFVAVDWALHVATGRRWQGRKVRKGRVLYVAAEGALGIKKRVRAWEKNNAEFDDGSFVVVQDAVQLAETMPLQALIRFARDFDFVVIDTLARTSAGLDENSATDMGQYVAALYKIRDASAEAGNTTLVIHHTGYSDKKRQRGSSSLYANIDGQVMIEAEDPHDIIRMRITKRKDGEIGSQLAMCLVQVETEFGSSCIVCEMDTPEPEQTNVERVLDAVRGGAETQAEIAEASGLNVGTVSRELRELGDAGHVVKIDGRPARYSAV